MIRLRKILGTIYVVLGLIYFFIFITNTAFNTGQIGTGHALRNHHSGPTDWIIFDLIPFLFGVCFGMAAWKIRNGERAARPWSIAASIILLVQTTPILVSLFFTRPGTFRILAPSVASFFVILGAMCAIGVAGLVAFIPRNSVSQGLPKTIRPPRVAGDGTSKLIDIVAWLIATVGYFAFMGWWRRWAHSEGLPSMDGLVTWLLLFSALFLSVAVHEAGHAVAGMCLGMKLRLFFVGPFQFRVQGGVWRFDFNLKNCFAVGGATGCVPTDPNWEAMDEIWMIAAGPISSFLLGCTATGMALTAKGSSYESWWGFFAYMAAISLVAAAVNMLPIRPSSAYSDGARIYQLLKGGAWADQHRVISVVLSTLVTPLRPRDYDLYAIQKAELSFTQGIDAMLLRLYKSDYFLDCGLFDNARDAFHEVVSLYPAAEPFISGDLLTAIVFRSALYDRNAETTRQWWQKLQANMPSHIGVDYALAASAMSWLEGQFYEAQSLWQQATDLADKLPRMGAFDFDRYLCELLRAEISASRHAQERTKEMQTIAADGYRVPEPIPFTAFSEL